MRPYIRGPATGEIPVLVRWLADGRGDALRHLGWAQILAAVTEHLCTDMARALVQADLAALETLDFSSRPVPDHARISPNVRAALERLPVLRPETEIGAAQARLDELLGIEALVLHGEPDGPAFEAALSRLEDLGESLTAVRNAGVLSVVELIGVAELCRACAHLAKAFAQTSKHVLDGDWTRGLQACAARLVNASGAGAQSAGGGPTREQPIEQCPSLLAQLDRSIDRTGEEPQISSKASPALADARGRLRACKQGLQTKAERLLRNPTIAESLRDRYWTERDGRIVLPVRSDRLGAVRSGGAIIHGSSASGHTFFVEPGELVEDNNALREAELAVAEEERKILRLLTAAVAEHGATLRGMQAACVELDLMLARLRFGEALGGKTLGAGSDRRARIPTRFDELGERGELAQIDLRAARHPLMLLDGIDVVPNDILLERGHALVISGPNAGGKTVALKTLGIFALMAASGFALPCDGHPRIPLFTHIITDIGDDQSINANLSTFSAHIGHVDQALRAAAEHGASTLVLLDEVAVGTDPEQGAALAEAILVGLVEAGATVVVTTHYDRLKLLATAPPTMQRFHNAAVGFDLAHMRPTFRLSLGVPGSSSAIAVARRLGLPESVLVRAEQLLGDEGLKIDELLRDIEAERQSLARTRERLERDTLHLRDRDSEVRARERRVLEGVRSRRAKAYAAAAEQLRELEIELKSKRKHLRQVDPERAEALPTRAALSDARAALAQHRAEAEAEAAAEIRREDRVDRAALAIGDRVRVLSMKQDGEVVALLGSPPKRATVQLPNLRTTVKLDDLLRPQPVVSSGRHKPGKATPILDFRAIIDAQSEAHFGASPVPVKVGTDNACDVRGHRFEDAQDQVERFVADALARDQDVIVIRHGHGGGALRKAVREVLGRLDHVRAQRSGLVSEGGEGVTVAWLG